MGAVYKQLSITERRRIERWRHAKVPVDEMARVLGRCRSTIIRDLKRNYFSDESMPKCDGYYGAAVHLMQAERRARDRKLIKYPELCKRVIKRIKDGWTPEQIGNRMIHEKWKKWKKCDDRPTLSLARVAVHVSHTTYANAENKS